MVTEKGYDSVDDEIVWGIVETHLPRLRDEVAKLLSPPKSILPSLGVDAPGARRIYPEVNMIRHYAPCLENRSSIFDKIGKKTYYR